MGGLCEFAQGVRGGAAFDRATARPRWGVEGASGDPRFKRCRHEFALVV